MTFDALEPVVLVRDLPDHGLARGDLGAVVEAYDERTYEVEFVTVGGGARALLTLDVRDLRQVDPHDVVAVRPTQPAA
ncbi:MAG TPA: DUF4926 domain-containing protein [Myxococcota bacterium]|nr:DUF4926 domain-containing protein [Myxococcota bacterium]